MVEVHCRPDEALCDGDQSQTPEMFYRMVQDVRSVAEAVGRLSAEQQQVLHLVAVEGLSYQEAADAVGIPIGTLISRLSRARARLRALDDDEPAGRAPASLRIVEN